MGPCEWFDFGDNELMVLPQPALTARERHVIAVSQGRGTDSVTTFGRGDDPSHDPSAAGAARARSRDMDTQSTSSAGSYESLQTHLTEHLNHELDRRFNDFQKTLLDQMKNLLKGQNPTLPTTVTTTPSTTEPSTLTTSHPPDGDDVGKTG